MLLLKQNIPARGITNNGYAGVCADGTKAIWNTVSLPTLTLVQLPLPVAHSLPLDSYYSADADPSRTVPAALALQEHNSNRRTCPRHAARSAPRQQQHAPRSSPPSGPGLFAPTCSAPPPGCSCPSPPSSRRRRSASWGRPWCTWTREGRGRQERHRPRCLGAAQAEAKTRTQPNARERAPPPPPPSNRAPPPPDQSAGARGAPWDLLSNFWWRHESTAEATDPAVSAVHAGNCSAVEASRDKETSADRAAPPRNRPARGGARERPVKTRSSAPPIFYPPIIPQVSSPPPAFLNGCFEAYTFSMSSCS